MKKYLAILLSLALVFCFISCDGSTKTPDGSNGSSSGSVTAVPKDSNVPDKSDFEPMNDSDGRLLQEIMQKTNNNKNYTLQGEEHYTAWFTIRDNAIISFPPNYEPCTISGTYSVKFDLVQNNDIVKESETLNGTITIGTDEYTLLDIVRIDNGIDVSLTGKAKKKGIETEIDVSTIESSEPGLYYFLTSFNLYPDDDKSDKIVIDTFIHLVTFDEPDLVGQISEEEYMEGNSRVKDTVMNISKIKLSDGKYHSLTYNCKAYMQEEKAVFNYLSIDGKYFTKESLGKYGLNF